MAGRSAANSREHRPTLAEVAAASGVSFKTVSRVVNGEPHVAAATREKVLRATRELGFELNPMASLLKRGVVTGGVAFITGDLANPFYSRLAQGVEREVRERGLQLTIASSDERPDIELALIDQFVLNRVSGILITSTRDSHADLAGVQERGVPLVFVDRPPVDLAADAFVVDNYGGSRAAVEHLLAAGHRRIGYLGDFARLAPQRERLRGYRDALRAAGVQGDDLVREGAHDAESARRLAVQLFGQAPDLTAIFAANNRVTLGVLRAIGERGGSRSGQADPALVGFDDFDFADVSGVTTVSFDPAELGRRAARALLDSKGGAGRDTQPPRTWIQSTTVVPRGSGEIPPPGSSESDPED